MGSDINVVNIRGARLVSNFILSPILLASLIFPFQAHAGVFSFIANLFSSTQVKAETTTPNSQTMALLQATISPNRDSFSTTTKEIAIVGGTSLLSETSVAVEQKTIGDDQISLYVVHSGDTLPAIAKMFGVSVNTIRWGNDIKGNTITVGQTLVILPISGVQHTVKSGDTLQSIAKLHKGDLDEILQYNNLAKDSKLAIGDVIVVPDGELVTSVVNVSSGSSSASPTYSGYYLKPVSGGIRSQGIHGHNGVDIVCRDRGSCFGANILASADGEVIISRSSGYNGGYGSYIVIRHSNGTQTLYGHLSSALVGVGERVTQGQVIGKMGSTGKSSGVHVHFEIRGARNPF